MSPSGQMETEIAFCPDEPFFTGHFPGHPVVPGVMLIDSAVAAAERMLGRKIALKGMRKVKFLNPLLPGETVKVRLDCRGEGEVSYLFSRNDAPCASGILVF